MVERGEWGHSRLRGQVEQIPPAPLGQGPAGVQGDLEMYGLVPGRRPGLSLHVAPDDQGLTGQKNREPGQAQGQGHPAGPGEGGGMLRMPGGTVFHGFTEYIMWAEKFALTEIRISIVRIIFVFQLIFGKFLARFTIHITQSRISLEGHIEP